MKKFGIKSFRFTVFFVVFFILINIIYLGIIASTDYDFRKRIESLNFNDPDFDLLVLGASTSLDAIDAELLTSNGIKSYNLAIGGSSIRTNYIQLDEYLTRYNQKPQYVLLGLNSALVKTFDDDEIQPIVEVTMRGHRFTLNDVPISKFKWLGFELVKKIVSKKQRNARLVCGQLKFQKTSPDITSYKESYLNIQEFESAYWIGEIARLCHQKEIELIVLEMPGYRETQNFSDTGPYILTLNKEFSVNLYNLNSKDFCTIFDSEKDWIGNSHLNEFGATKFTKELISIIKNKSNRIKYFPHLAMSIHFSN